MVIVLARNWWALVLRGLFGVLFGIMAFVWPGVTLAVVALLYGAYALVDGVFAITAAVVGSRSDIPWWALAVEGLLGITVGVITFCWPGITELALILMIAAWSVVTGVFEIVAAIRLRKEVRGEWLLALSGMLSILFGGILVVFPVAGAVAISWLIGAYAITFGVLFMFLGFRLRSWSKLVTTSPIMPTDEPMVATGPVDAAAR